MLDNLQVINNRRIHEYEIGTAVINVQWGLVNSRTQHSVIQFIMPERKSANTVFKYVTFIIIGRKKNAGEVYSLNFVW